MFALGSSWRTTHSCAGISHGQPFEPTRHSCGRGRAGGRGQGTGGRGFECYSKADIDTLEMNSSLGLVTTLLSLRFFDAGTRRWRAAWRVRILNRDPILQSGGTKGFEICN